MPGELWYTHTHIHVRTHIHTYIHVHTYTVGGEYERKHTDHWEYNKPLCSLQKPYLQSQT